MNKKSEKRKVAEFFSVLMAFFVVSVFGMQMLNAYSNNQKMNTDSEKEGDEVVLNIDSTVLQMVANKYENVDKLSGVELEALELKLNDIYTSNLDDITKKEALRTLGEVEVYSDDLEFAASLAADVLLNRPTIKYNPLNDTWTINATGGLGADKIQDELPIFGLFVPKKGDTRNIGGVDGVLLSITGLTNTGTTSNGLTIVSGYGYLSAGTPSKSEVMVTKNDDYGVAYEIQDKITYTNVNNYLVFGTYSYNYNAASINCRAIYDKKFANFSGQVKLGYSHTWSSTSVNSISLSVDGAGFGWDKKTGRWQAYSYGRNFENGYQR